MRVLFVTVFLLILDQITKTLTRVQMDLHESIPIIQNFFHLTYVANDGMAFGINFPAGIYVFTFVSFVASIGLAWYLWHVRKATLLLRISLAFILAGAVGNLIDRVLFQEVVDFLDFMIAGHHWPVFNVADSSVTVGMFFFLYYSLILQPKLETAHSPN